MTTATLERPSSVRNSEQAILKMVDDGNRHFEQTGLHVTTNEIRTWLAAVKLNPNAPRPTCHV